MDDCAKIEAISKRYRGSEWLRIGVILGLSLGLVSGCFGPSTGSKDQGDKKVAEKTPEAVAALPDARKPSTESKTTPSLSPEERDPNRLVDLPPTEISELLGPPGRVRKEASMRVWQYRTDTCVLDLFLYKQPQSYRVVYYEFRSPTLDQVAEDECFVDLVTRKRS